MEVENQVLLMNDKEFLRDETVSVLIDKPKSIDQMVKVSESFSEKQNLINDFESMVINDLFGDWLQMEDMDQPGMTIAEAIIKEEILNNGQQQNIGNNVVLEDKNKTLDENLPIVVENSEQKVEKVKEENHHHLTSHKRAYTKGYSMQIIL